MEKFDKFAIKIYNGIIIHTIAIAIFLITFIIIAIGVLFTSHSDEIFRMYKRDMPMKMEMPLPNYSEIVKSIKENGGLKNDE